jgi:hypothetical protein
MPSAQASFSNTIQRDEFHVEQFSEDQQMTFQVAFIGSDGLIVGSDRLMSYVTPNPEEPNSAWQTTQTLKFVKSADGAIVCTYAGGQLAKNMAVGICGQHVPSGPEINWENVLYSVTRYSRPPQSVTDEIIAVRRDLTDAFWVVRKDNAASYVQKITADPLCVGVNSPARFLARYLYQRAPVGELKPLLLLTLAYASVGSPSVVGGEFDIMTLTSDGAITWDNFDAEKVKQGPLYSAFNRGLIELFHQASQFPPL